MAPRQKGKELRRFGRAIPLALVVSLVMAGVALADVVTNDLDATLEVMNLEVGGANGSTVMTVTAADTLDPVSGCNHRGNGGQVTLGVKSSNTSVATVSQSTIQFTRCAPDDGSTATVTVTPVGNGSATISLSTAEADGASLTTNSGAALSNYNVAPAAFTVNVTTPLPANTAPTTPGTPSALPASPNQGGFTLNWAASTDDGNPNPPALTYELQGMDADDAAFGPVASGLTNSFYSFAAGEPAEGTWIYRVRASDSALTSDWSASSDPIVVDRTAPTFGACEPVSFLRNSGGGSETVSITAADPTLLDGSTGSGVNAGASTLSGSVDTTTVGEKSLTFTAVDEADNSAIKECKYQIVLNVTGFDQPVDMVNRNLAKAGQAIPLKFQVSDALGPVTDLTAADVVVKVASLLCERGVTLDEVEEYAAGNSGLQNLGGGYYQFNWKTPTSYANSCKTMTLTAGGGAKSAEFEFRK